MSPAAATRVLVIDDSATVRKSIELSFRGAPPSILDFASSGADGIERALNGRPDLVLLDFVLPDMKGPEVCRRLAGDPRTAETPILLLTGKDGSVLEQFHPFPSVMDYIRKPFDAAQLRAQVRSVLAQRTKLQRAAVSTEAAAATGPIDEEAARAFAQKEAVAQAIYGLLRERLGSIPSWMAQIGEQAPAPYFARKLLTPELLDEITALAAPIGAAVEPSPAVASPAGLAAATPAAPSAPASPRPAPLLEGTLGDIGVLEILRLAAAATPEHTWLFTAEPEEGGGRTFAYVRQGRVIFAGETDPDSYGVGSVFAHAPRSPVHERAFREQRESGKPFPLTLAEQGLFPPEQLPRVLQEQGLGSLRRQIGARRGRFELRAATSIPIYVEAYAHPVSLAQLELLALRDTLDTGRMEALVPGHDAVFARSDSFGRLVAAYEWTTDERRLLAAIDGRSTVTELAARLGLGVGQMTPLLAALVAVDLVRPVAQATAPLRKVAIQDDGEPSFRRDLRAYLEKRSRALTFVELAQGANVLTAIENERPFLFITNGPRESLHRTARAVRALPFVRGMTMATMVDGGTEEDIRALMASGFNVVLRKPVHVTDLEGLLLEAQASLSSLEAELNVRSVTSLSASIPPPHRAGRTG